MGVDVLLHRSLEGGGKQERYSVCMKSTRSEQLLKIAKQEQWSLKVRLSAIGTSVQQGKNTEECFHGYVILKSELLFK